MILLGLLASPAMAQTNTNAATVLEQAQETAKQAFATNYNQIVLEILQGGLDAGKEVYAASKQAITKSVDFAMEQAPLVVKEFLAWKLLEAVIWFIVWLMVSIGLLWAARCLHKYAENSKWNEQAAVIVKWIIRGVAIFIFIVNFGCNMMTVAEIKVAPRWYLIEYVVDELRPHVTQGTQR